MSQSDCRRAMHDAERHARNMESGNAFALANAEASIDAARAAYFATDEEQVAQRLHVAIDIMEGAAQ